MKTTYPRWTGGYTLKPQGTIRRRRLISVQDVPVFEYVADKADPLTLWLSETDWRRPFRHFDKFDFGSVPLLLQSVVSPLAAPRAFILHDSCYEFAGVWTPAGLREITRREADDLLYIGMRAEGVGWYTRQKTWLGVRAGGGWVWSAEHTTLENTRRDAQARMMI